MDPLVLGALVAIVTIVVLFSGVSVAAGLLIVSAMFLIAFEGAQALSLMPKKTSGISESACAPSKAMRNIAETISSPAATETPEKRTTMVTRATSAPRTSGS
ncbi:MAG: hypothetical protein AAFV96_04720, partial [Pseudomonadota bacterium]